MQQGYYYTAWWYRLFRSLCIQPLKRAVGWGYERGCHRALAYSWDGRILQIPQYICLMSYNTQNWNIVVYGIGQSGICEIGPLPMFYMNACKQHQYSSCLIQTWCCYVLQIHSGCCTQSFYNICVNIEWSLSYCYNICVDIEWSLSYKYTSTKLR